MWQDVAAGDDLKDKGDSGVPGSESMVKSVADNLFEIKSQALADAPIERPDKCRVIEVGDNLSNQTLFLNFPDTLYNTELPGISGRHAFNAGFDAGINPTYTYSYFTDDTDLLYSVHLSTPLETPEEKALYYYNTDTQIVTTNLSYVSLSSGVRTVEIVDRGASEYHFIKIPDSRLRHIRVGDDLSGKRLYLDFPNDLVLSSYDDDYFIEMLGDTDPLTFFSNGNTKGVYILDVDVIHVLFNGSSTASFKNLGFFDMDNIVSVPSFVVSTVNIDNPAYKYIYILDDAPADSKVKVYNGTEWKNVLINVATSSGWKESDVL